MTPGSTRLVLGCVAIVAAAGAAAYVLTDRPPPAAPTPAPAPAHEAPSHEAAPEPAQPAAPEAPATLAFEPLQQNFSLVHDSAAYTNASLEAPQLYPLVAGTGLKSASRSADGKWIVAMTQDGQAAYIPAGDLGPYDPSRAPATQEPAAPVAGQVKGSAHVVNTATLLIDGQTVKLAGLLGKMGKFASQLQTQADAQAPVTCVPSGDAYTCSLQDGTDVARLALSTGLAETAPNASADYQSQEAAAHEARIGLWK